MLVAVCLVSDFKNELDPWTTEKGVIANRVSNRELSSSFFVIAEEEEFIPKTQNVSRLRVLTNYLTLLRTKIFSEALLLF